MNNTKMPPLWTFNCGGCALKTFNWYLPGKKPKRNYLRTGKFVNYMLEEFDGRLRKIKKEEEALPYERVIFFRGSRDDFHFIYKGKNGKYYHKRGDSPKIERIEKEVVYSNCWLNEYVSKITILALDMR